MLLELKQVKKYFRLKPRVMFGAGQIIKAVDDVSLIVDAGETFSVVGESGSGKSTLGRMMAGLYKPDDGEIYFKKRSLRLLRGIAMRDFRRNVSIVFQDPLSSLDPRFTVERILNEAFTLEPKVSKAERRERMLQLLDVVRLSKEGLLRYPHEFSGGERQRIAIARALICRPQLVILDEAVSSLDVLVQDEILKLLVDLKEKFGLTYVFISHNLGVVQKISDKIAVMFQGKIVEIGPAGEVIKNPQHPYTQELLGAAFEYRSQAEDRSWAQRSNGSIRDCGNGHLVMDAGSHK